VTASVNEPPLFFYRNALYNLRSPEGPGMKTKSVKTAAAAIAVCWLGAVALRAGAAPEPQSPPKPAADVPTFSKDVAPILYKNCTTCHRPGEIAPMSLLTYDDARPHAKAIRDEINEGHMPPWHANAPRGTFANERLLTDAERDTLLKWASNGAPKGDPADLPPVPKYTDGWSLGTPDAVFEMIEPYKVPAEGEIQYEYFYIPTNFTEAKWVKSIEVRPSSRAVVHHVLVYYRAAPDMQRTAVLQPNPELSRTPPERPSTGIRTSAPRPGLPPRRLIASYAPGTSQQVAPEGTAFRLEPGGIIELQMHYTTNGEAATDRTRVGLIYARGEGLREVRAAAFINGSFTIPAGAKDVAVNSEVGFLQDTTVWGLLPHTHLRGTRWLYVLELPDGSKKTILDVLKYDFNWQTYYMFKEPLVIPKGSKIVATAWYDNSPSNKFNPDAKVDVKWGDQTWEEMQYTGILFSPVNAPAPGGSK
jgi:hypothetical protein